MATDSTTAERDSKEPTGAPISTHLWALLGFFALALVATYPTVLHFTTNVTGDLLPDRNQHLWDIWWAGQALAHFTNPYHTNMLFYPFGVGLYYHALGLSNSLFGLIPLALLGLPAAYNTVVLAAITLSGYGAFRLALLYTGRPLPSFLGGVVFGLMPYTLEALNGQTEVLSTQWMPFYAEAWLRAWRSGKPAPMLLAGLFLALAAYGSLYYATYLLLFTLVHIAYSLVASRERRASLRRLLTVGGVVAVFSVLLSAPLLIGLARSYNDPRLELPASDQMLTHSADPLSLFALPHDHPLLGQTNAPPSNDEPYTRSYITLGYVAFALSMLGAVVAWRERETRFWVLLAAIALVLALGPELQIGRTLTGIPLPFKLVAGLPGVSAIGKVSRFVVLVRLCMAVLAAWGGAWLITRLTSMLARTIRRESLRRALPFAAVLSLLLVELPLHPRYNQPLDVPPGFAQLAAQNDDGGLMELPIMTKQVAPLGQRMLYQTVHGHPIMGAYLSRVYDSPITDACSPFWNFISPEDAPVHGGDITTPTVASRPLDLLNFYNIRYVALYSKNAGPDSDPVVPSLLVPLEDVVVRVSHTPPLYTDDYVTIHKVDPAPLDTAPASFYMGHGWYQIEHSGDQPFRWVKDGHATLCVFSPHPMKAYLVMNALAFAHDRRLDLLLGSDPGVRLTSTSVHTGGFSQLRTASIDWPAGLTEVNLVAPDPGQTPVSLDPNIKDNRSFTVAISDVHFEPSGAK